MIPKWIRSKKNASSNSQLEPSLDKPCEKIWDDLLVYDIDLNLIYHKTILIKFIETGKYIYFGLSRPPRFDDKLYFCFSFRKEDIELIPFISNLLFKKNPIHPKTLELYYVGNIDIDPVHIIKTCCVAVDKDQRKILDFVQLCDREMHKREMSRSKQKS